MSAITYLTNIVTSLTNRFNQLEANSKKVDELPAQTTLEPTSKIPVSRGGTSEHLTVQQIISSIQNSNYNQLTSVGAITVDGTDILIEPVSGQINGNSYATTTNTTIAISLCDTGFNRKDILVLTTSNTVVAISGEETDGSIVIAPPTPLDAIYITEFDVSDSSIGAPIDPIIGTQFKKKSESLGYGDPSLSGTNAVIQLRPEGNSRYAFSNAGLVSIDGFGLDLITLNPSAEAPYDGKDLFIENTGTTPMTLLHDGPGTADSKFFFLDEQDLIIPAGEKVWLKYGNPYCEVIFKSWGSSDSTFKVIAQNFTNSSVVTGTTSLTELETFTIPANTFQVGDRLIFTCRFLKPISTGQTQHQHMIGGGIGSEAFGVFSSTSGTTYSQITKELTIKSETLTEGLGGNMNTTTSDVNFNAGILSNLQKNINWSIDQYIKIRLVNQFTTDQAYVSFWQLIRIRP